MGVLALCHKKGSVAAVKQCYNMPSWFWSCLEMQERFGCALFKVGNARWWRQNCMWGAIQNWPWKSTEFGFVSIFIFVIEYSFFVLSLFTSEHFFSFSSSNSKHCSICWCHLLGGVGGGGSGICFSWGRFLFFYCLTFCSCFPRNMFGIPWACLGWQLTVTFKSCHYLLTGHRRPKGRWRRGGDGSCPRWGRGGWISTEKSNPCHCQSSQHVHPNQRAREGWWHQQSQARAQGVQVRASLHIETQGRQNCAEVVLVCCRICSELALKKSSFYQWSVKAGRPSVWNIWFPASQRSVRGLVGRRFTWNAMYLGLVEVLKSTNSCSFGVSVV